MLRYLILFVPLAVLLFFGGVQVGRAGKRRAIEQQSSDVRSVLAAARNLTDIDWLERPNDASIKVQSLQLALDEYDHHRRKEVL